MRTRNKIAAIVIVAFIILIITVAALPYFSTQLHSTGKVTAVGVPIFSDSALTKPTDQN